MASEIVARFLVDQMENYIARCNNDTSPECKTTDLNSYSDHRTNTSTDSTSNIVNLSSKPPSPLISQHRRTGGIGCQANGNNNQLKTSGSSPAFLPAYNVTYTSSSNCTAPNTSTSYVLHEHHNEQGSPLLANDNNADLFNAIKRKLTQVHANIEHNYKAVVENISSPFRRRNQNSLSLANSSQNCDTEEFTFIDSSDFLGYPEHIEMAYLPHSDSGILNNLEPIRGHLFVPQQLTNPTWCDKCADFIWGVYKQCLRCEYCNYTCHHRCRPAVTLDCTKVLLGNGDFSNGPVNDDAPSTEESTRTEESTKTDRTSLLQSSNYALEPPASTVNSHSDETDSGYRSGPLLDEGPLLDDVSETSSTDTTLTEAPCPSPGNTLTHDELTRDSLSRQIEDCNDNCPFASITLSDDDLSFQGFLRVTLNLIRPITMSLGLRPPSIYEILTREHIVEQNTMEVSFYMPRDTVKAIHVTSTTTTKEVIASLLKKFKILDNARKFAMYEQEVRDKKIVKIRRVVDKETPLHLILEWGADHIGTHRLVLQENETGEVEWGAFSLPELNNFLRILDREEDECISQLGYKYKVMKRIIHQRLKELRKERSQQQVAQQQRS